MHPVIIRQWIIMLAIGVPLVFGFVICIASCYGPQAMGG